MTVPPETTIAQHGAAQPDSMGRLLVVDDLEANRRILRGLLQRFGYEIAEAEDGEMALGMIRDNDYDTILLDIMMPKMDGYEVCNRLKSDVRTEHIPVLLVTALCDRDSRLRGMQAGADEFLSKPFDSKYLPIRIQNAVRAKRLHDQVEDNFNQLSRSERARSALVQAIVHDLRSPLCSIQGSLALHEQATDLETAKSHIRQARGECSRMINMVGELLDVHRFEAGEIAVHPETSRITTLVGEAVKELPQPNAVQRLKLQLSSPELTCWADPGILVRVLRNLVVRALSVSPEGTDVPIIGTTESDGSVRLAVHDRGPAIPAELHATIFEKFHYDPSVIEQGTVKATPTWLSLAYCRLAIEAHGGRIGLETSSEGGNQFWCHLPPAPQA